ncbi:hypothetical protein quinque_009179 [Culex quinquefasciatus]
MGSTYDRETKVWSGPHKPSILNPEASFGQTLLAMLSLNPDRVIQIDVDTGRSMTCGEMRLRAIRAAQNLTALGLSQGDMVSMACANSENLMPMVLGLLINGMPFNSLSPEFGLDDVAHMMKITQPKMVFCDVSNYELTMRTVDLVVKNKPLVYVFECESKNVNQAEDLLKETGREQMFSPPYLGDSRKQLGVVICSSGTTGFPKGVADLCFDLLEKYPVDYIFTPPSYANILLIHPRLKTVDFSSIKLWAFSGSFLPAKIRDSIAALLPNGRTMNGYGNTEIGGFATDIMKQKPLSVGTLMANVKAKIVDDNGYDLCNGEQGEVLVKFSEVFSGYYNNPEASVECVDAEGWFRTGDIAYFDEEGFLFLVDRKKDLLTYQNYQIAPAEMEALIGKIDGVKDVAVVGLLDGDGVSDLVTAVIVKTSESTLTKEKVLEIVHGIVADYKKLRGGVYFVSEIPLSSAGKPLRRKIRENLMQQIKPPF